MSQTTELKALPQLYREMRLELRKRVCRAAPEVTEQDGKFLATRGELTASGATLEEAIAALKLLEQAARAERRATVEAERKAKQMEMDEEMDEDEEDEEDEDERDADSFDISFSSEASVERWFGNEVLDHSAKSIDLTRAQGGLAYLVDHNTRDQVGIIENLRVSGKKLRGTVRFSRSQRAQDIKRDLEDGIRPYTSIGYRVNAYEVTKGQGDAPSTYRATNWTPMEGSTVAVPADCTVGMGRAENEAQQYPVQIRSAEQAAAPTTTALEAKPAASAPAATHVEVRTTMTPKETLELTRTAKAHGVDDNRIEEILSRDGQTADAASREILTEIGKRNGAPIQTPASEQSQNMLELTEREQKQYSICRGVLTMADNQMLKRNENCFEMEVSEELAKRHEGKNHGGLFVPYGVTIDEAAAQRAAQAFSTRTMLTSGGTNVGKETVFTEPGSFIQYLYNKSCLKEMGAEMMTGLVGPIAFPKQTGKASGSWVAENPGADVTDSNLTTAQVSMSPKTYQSSSAYTRQLLAQSSIDVDNLVRRDLATDASLAVDLAGIAGLGSGSNQPLGITGTSGVQAYVLKNDTANGATPVWDDITFMEELLGNANADQVGVPQWLTSYGIKGLFKRTARLGNTTGDPIWASGDTIDGYSARACNQVPKTLVRGTSSNCHALIFAVFQALINGMWGSGFELVVDPYRLKKQGIIELTTFLMTDWANRFPAAFVLAKALNQ
jgi:HK97 family phage major capsid protein